MNWLEKLAYKKVIKGANKCVEDIKRNKEAIEKSLNEEDKKQHIEKLREGIIIGLIGDGKKEIGLLQLFEVTEEDDGKEVVITREYLEKQTTDYLIELFEDLINQLGKEI